MSASLASSNDIETIHELARTIWLEHYPPIIGEAQTLFMLDKMYGIEALRKQMNDGLQFYLWTEDGLAVAFAAIDSMNFDYGFLSKLYVDKAKRGGGIAQKFLQFLGDRILEVGKKSIQLTVNRQNIGAINFYFKEGFKIIRCADFDIGEGYFMNDFIMEKRL